MITIDEIEKKYPLSPDAEAGYREAKHLFDQGQTEKALSVILYLLEEYPDQPRLLNAAASLYRAEGDFNIAEDYFLAAAKCAPDYVSAYNNLCLLYCENGRHETAAEYARLTLKIIKSSPIPWDTLGLYYLTKGEVKRALEHFLAAYQYDPGYTRAAYNIACCYSRLGETDKALRYLAESLDTERRIEIAQQDADLANIRGLPEFERVLNKAGEKLSTSARDER